MNKLLLTAMVLSVAFSTTSAKAGLLGKVLKGGALVGAGAMIGRSVSADTPEGKRLSKMNTYVWNALKAHQLDKPNMMEYIKQLEKSQDIRYADTAALGYAIYGNRAKGIEIYKNEILPYLPLEDQKTQNNYNFYYKVVKTCKPKTCAGIITGKLSLATQKPFTEEDKLRSLGKQIWHGLKYGQPYKTSALDRLAYSGNISHADTGAYGYAVRSNRKKALKIYEQEILPKLGDVSETKRNKYQSAYEFLKTCELQRCVVDRLKQK